MLCSPLFFRHSTSAIWTSESGVRCNLDVLRHRLYQDRKSERLGIDEMNVHDDEVGSTKTGNDFRVFTGTCLNDERKTRD